MRPVCSGAMYARLPTSDATRTARSEAETTQPNLARSGLRKEVRRLEIPVQKATLVQCVECRGETLRNREKLAEIPRAATHQRGERSSARVFAEKHQVIAFVVQGSRCCAPTAVDLASQLERVFQLSERRKSRFGLGRFEA